MGIQDKILKEYLRETYDVGTITNEFLESITQINLNQNINYNDLLQFKNLKEIIFTNISIDNSLYKILSNLKINKLTFLDCKLENFEYFKNSIKYLCINNCEIDNIYELNKFKNLDSLYLDEVNEIDLDYLTIIKNIKNLSFYNTKTINEDKLIILDKIENLCLAGTEIDSIDTLAYNETLKTLVIDKEIYDKNREVVKHLIYVGVNVIDYMNQNVESAYGV